MTHKELNERILKLAVISECYQRNNQTHKYDNEIIENQILISRLNQLNKLGYIWGYMYGSPWLNTSQGYKRDRLIQIYLPKLQLENTALYYQRGWPGPDWNLYKFEDYGKTWAYYKKEIKDVPMPES